MPLSELHDPSGPARDEISFPAGECGSSAISIYCFCKLLILGCTDRHVKEELSLKAAASARLRKAKPTTTHPALSTRQSGTAS